MLRVLEASGCDEEMRAPDGGCPCDHSFSIAGMVVVLAELLVGEVGGDIEEVVAFLHQSAHLLQHI